MKAKPTFKFDQEVFDVILTRLRDGESLREICATPGMPPRIDVWLWRDDPKVEAQYAKAKLAGCEAIADDILHMSKTPREGKTTTTGPRGVEEKTGDMVDRDRLAVDTRKWYLSKIAPKLYGDKSTLDLNIKTDISARLLAGRKRAGRGT